MSQVILRGGRKFQPPLKKTPVTPAADPEVHNNNNNNTSALDSTVSTNSQLPHSQVHTLLSFCDENVSQRKCTNETPTISLRGKENKNRVKKTYQYKYFKNHKNVSVIKRAKLFSVATSRKETPVKDKLSEVYEYTLTPASTQESVAKKKKKGRSEEQIAIDKLVLSRIALTMAEIRAIRLEYQHTVAARPNKLFPPSWNEDLDETSSTGDMEIDNLTPCLFNHEREP